MFTFLPYSDYERIAKTLSDSDLARQRIETFALIQQINGYVVHTRNSRGPLPREKWKLKPVDETDQFVKRIRLSPIFLMWEKNIRSLYQYQQIVCAEYMERTGKYDETLLKTEMVMDACVKPARPLRPNWLKDGRLHVSHQALLLKKNYLYYRSKFGNVPSTPIYWPVRERVYS